MSLRELHVALSKVQCGGSAESIDGAQAALALASLLQALAGNGGSDREAAGAAAEGGYSKQVVWLTDCQYEPEELQRAVKVGGSPAVCAACAARPQAWRHMGHTPWLGAHQQG